MDVFCSVVVSQEGKNGHKNKGLKMYVLKVLRWPEKEKMAHKKKGPKNVCYAMLWCPERGKAHRKELKMYVFVVL